jgi:uncharacterized protein
MANMINRRKFFKKAALPATGIILGSSIYGLSGCQRPGATMPASCNIMEEVMKYRKINAHEHVWPEVSPDALIDFSDRLGVEKLVISSIIPDGPGRVADPQGFRACNDLVLKAMKNYPGRFLGQAFLNPVYGKESLEEIKRCIDAGMIGLKIYNQVKISDPLFYPVIEKLIDLKMVMLVHAHCGLGVGGYRTRYGNVQPNASIPEDFAMAAKRYPEAIFQYAHLHGGSDWEYACRVLKDYPNVYADLSGSNNEANTVNFALRHLGEDRLLFGSDGSHYQGIGTILSSDLNDAQRKKIFFDNFNNILRKSGNHVN